MISHLVGTKCFQITANHQTQTNQRHQTDHQKRIIIEEMMQISLLLRELQNKNVTEK